VAHDLIHLMNALFLPAAKACRETRWSPPADVYRTPDGWLVKFDLAGVRPEDLHLAIGRHRLTVQGIRRDRCADACACHQRLEINYSQFERSIELPCNLETMRIAMEYRDGMLLVRVRDEEAQP
jgi:HSP20 family protein